jgi:hypothetical protein
LGTATWYIKNNHPGTHTQEDWTPGRKSTLEPREPPDSRGEVKKKVAYNLPENVNAADPAAPWNQTHEDGELDDELKIEILLAAIARARKAIKQNLPKLAGIILEAAEMEVSA